MDNRDYISSDSERDSLSSDRPAKRPRRSSPQPPQPSSSRPPRARDYNNGHADPHHMSNGNSHRDPDANQAHDPHSSGTDSLPFLSPSIIGVEPIDEFIREIADFIHFHIGNRPQDAGGLIEVEAKIGVMKDRASGQRLQLPVLVETILAPGATDLRFESDMSARQHQHFNVLLNKLKLDKPELGITYEHLHLVDNFFAPDSGHGEKIRVTRDEKTSQVRACMRKVRLGDLNIYCPKRAVDWRVSVNLEIPVPPPLGSPTHTRRKDRLSYTHQEFAIDLTQVTATDGPNSRPRVLHELEVELKHSDYLLMVAAKRGQSDYTPEEQVAFDELIHAFVNNARILTRNANLENPR